jgi:hypothetical protein
MSVNDAYASMTREQWLNAVALGLAPLFKEVGAPLPQRFRVTMSLTKKKTAVGTCYDPSCSADGTTEILVRLDRFDPVEIAAILAHELVHAAVGVQARHGPRFRRVALAIGLEGHMTATVPGAAFLQRLEPVLLSVGPLPHAALNFNGPRSGPKKQATRLLKAECAECGYTVRVTKTWVLCAGAPLCPSDEVPMVVDMPEEDGDGE